MHVAELTIDGSKTSPLPHFWSACVGSSHGAMWLRADWKKHLEMAHEMGGFHYGACANSYSYVHAPC